LPYDEQAFYRFADSAEPDPDVSDVRGQFARDRDRIIYSTAFRRLAGKTQVVAAGEFGLFHTRLTHTLKVAQLGRRLAERLRERYEAGAGKPDRGLVGGPDPDLVEASCLAHDLGHPPFGHIGEKTLQQASDEVATEVYRRERDVSEWLPGPVAQLILSVRMRGRDRYLMENAGFEGNAQTFRVLSYLSAREPVEGRPGLDLTRATLDATTKYPWIRAHSRDGKKEWGAYGGRDSERLRDVRNVEPMGRGASPCFEAQLMNWCDDVTYAVHDVVDFYRSGTIPLDRLLTVRGRAEELSPEAYTFLARVQEQRPHLDFNEMLAAWREMARLSDIQYPWEPRARRKEQVQSTTSRLITFFVDDVGWAQRGTGQTRNYGFDIGEPLRYGADFVIDRDVTRADQKNLAVLLLKRLLWEYVIDRPELQSQQHGQAVIVRGLVRAYCENPKLLPADRQEELDETGDGVRAAVDQVASLTEAHAIALFQRFAGVSLGRFSDIL
jgi:dGTPase